MNRKGYSLVEITIVLVVIGVVTAGAVKMLNNSFNSSNNTKSKNTVLAAVKQLAEYSSRSQSLPASIGSAVSDSKDAFGNDLEYIADAATVNPPVSGNVASICSLKSTSTSLQICADDACSSVTQTFGNIAFFVASAGINENFQYSYSNNIISIFAENTEADAYPADGTHLDSYDDIAGWMNLDTLKTFAGCDGYALSIIQDKLPPLVHGNTYNYKLTPKGGVAPYQWCVESSDSANVQALTYDAAHTKTIKALSGCGTNDYTEANSINLYTGTAVSIAESDPATALIKVRLKDSKAASVVKDYTVQITKPKELAMAAKAPSASTPDPGTGSGAGDFVSSNTSDNNGNKAANKHSFLVTDDSITIVMNSGQSKDSAMVSCDPDPTKPNACPAFANHGLLRAYFVLEKYDTTSDNVYYLDWTYPLGFIFVTLKSYKPGTNYLTTFGMTGSADSGLGYGGSGGDPIGMDAGHTFGVEFDTYKDSGKNDKDSDHIAVVGYTDRTIYTNPRTYEAFSDNIHETSYAKKSCSMDTSGWVIQYNDPPDDTCGGTGFYYNSGAEVIPNSYPTQNRIGIRVEAVSGCNSSGTECNRKTGTENYVCVFAWRQPETTLNNNAALKANMQTMSVSHAYEALSGTANPLGTPIAKDCYRDDTESDEYLDYIRYGFTSSAWFTYSAGSSKTYMPHYFKLTDLAVNVSQY